MGKTVIQIYEVQKPAEAAALVALGVDHIGSVLTSKNSWKAPSIRKTMQTVQRLGAKSVLIPVFNDPTTLAEGRLAKCPYAENKPTCARWIFIHPQSHSFW